MQDVAELQHTASKAPLYVCLHQHHTTHLGLGTNTLKQVQWCHPPRLLFPAPHGHGRIDDNPAPYVDVTRVAGYT